MSAHEIAEAVMELSKSERLGLAQLIIASVAAERDNAAEISKAVKG